MAMSEGLGVTPVYNLDNKNDDGFFGGGGSLIFFLFFLLAWGGNGLGGFGGGNAAAATVANGINNDFMYTNLSASIRDNSIQNNSILSGIQQGICTLGYEGLNHARETQIAMMNGFNATQAEIANFSCTTQKELLVNRYEAEKNTAAIVNAIHADGEATRGLITQNTIQDLRDRLQTAEFANSQCAQTASIISQVRPYPIPSYPTCSPYTPYSGCTLC